MRAPTRAFRVQVVIDLEVDGRSARGTLTDSDGEAHAFGSWLALHTVLRSLGPHAASGRFRRPPSATGGPRSGRSPV